MKKSMLTKISVVFFAVMMLSACGRGMASTAPDLTLRDLDGEKVRLSSFKGKVIILNFFATWCPPCREEVPGFISLQETHGGKNFTVIAISLSRLGDTKRFADSYGINYPVLIDDGRAKDAYGPIRSIPMTVVIGRDFKIVKRYIGYRPKEVFEDDIRELSGQQ